MRLLCPSLQPAKKPLMAPLVRCRTNDLTIMQFKHKLMSLVGGPVEAFLVELDNDASKNIGELQADL
jgi:hypothetical protein